MGQNVQQIDQFGRVTYGPYDPNFATNVYKAGGGGPTFPGLTTYRNDPVLSATLGFERLATQERLRFLRERLRQGRAASILSLSGGDPGQGFQLGRKSVLGE